MSLSLPLPAPGTQMVRVWAKRRGHVYRVPGKVNWKVNWKCGNLSGNELTRHSSGNTQSQSSQLAEPLWTDSGLKSGISVQELISTLKKKKKKAQARNELSSILPKILAHKEKATTTSAKT